MIKNRIKISLPSTISSIIFCANLESTPRRGVWAVLVPPAVVRVPVVGALPFRTGEALGPESCRLTIGGVEVGLVKGRTDWTGGVRDPIIRGSVWLLAIAVLALRLAGTFNLRPLAKIKQMILIIFELWFLINCK